jgi:signal transduction histidine kinase/CheY-like chemotaxis protein
MTLFCPVTGLKAFSYPEWINQKVSDSLIASFWIIGRSIIYSLPKGRADLEGTRNALALNAKVASFVSGGTGSYIQIKDYAFLSGASLSARRLFANKMNNDNRRLSLIFCNLSPQLSIAVKIGKRFNTTGKYVHVAKHYKDAVKQALKLSVLGDLQQDTAHINLSKYFDSSNHSLVPVDLLSDDAWKIQTPEFSNNSVVIDQCIRHSTTKGYLEPKHIPAIERMRYLCQSAIPDDSRIMYIVVDSSKLKGASRLARAKFMQSLKSWHQQFPLRMYIVYGANTFMKTALHLARPLMPFKVRIARDIEHAFHLIRDDRSKNVSKKHAIRPGGKAAGGIHDDIEKLMALISRINWEQEGIHNRLDIDENHPLYFLYQSIKLIKEELDDLLKDRKRLEEQLHQSRKMESIGTMASGIAHDFNNILHTILGNADLAIRDIPDEHPSHSNLQEIKTSSLRAATIVKQFLNFSRKTHQKLKPIDAIAVIKDALQLLRSTIPTTIEIRKHLPDTDVTIFADPVQINQLLINLCTNASQEMEAIGGIIEINVETETIAEDYIDNYLKPPKGEYLKITVGDTGPGIEPNIIDRIFDPYFTTKDFGKGSGMGLAVVHGIVKNHNGFITVNSQPGKGAKFKMLFPVVAEQPVIDLKEPDEIPGGYETILFIDDEESIVNMTEQMLKRLGYKVKTKMNPVEALELFKSKPYRFDLVITDMTMPQMSGVKLYEKLMEIRADIPVIICTGHSALIDKKKSRKLGIAAYVMKPIVLRDIANTIRNVLDETKR